MKKLEALPPGVIADVALVELRLAYLCDAARGALPAVFRYKLERFAQKFSSDIAGPMRAAIAGEPVE